MLQVNCMVLGVSVNVLKNIQMCLKRKPGLDYFFILVLLDSLHPLSRVSASAFKIFASVNISTHSPDCSSASYLNFSRVIKGKQTHVKFPKTWVFFPIFASLIHCLPYVIYECFHFGEVWSSQDCSIWKWSLECYHCFYYVKWWQHTSCTCPTSIPEIRQHTLCMVWKQKP